MPKKGTFLIVAGEIKSLLLGDRQLDHEAEKQKDDMTWSNNTLVKDHDVSPSYYGVLLSTLGVKQIFLLIFKIEVAL